MYSVMSTYALIRGSIFLQLRDNGWPPKCLDINETVRDCKTAIFPSLVGELFFDEVPTSVKIQFLEFSLRRAPGGP